MKSNDLHSVATVQAVKEVFEKKLYNFKKTKSIIKIYTFKRKCLVQQTIYYVSSKLITWEGFFKVFLFLIQICQNVVQVFSILKKSYGNYQRMKMIYLRAIISFNMLIDQIIYYLLVNIVF